MKSSSVTFKVGTRASELARIQAAHVVAHLRPLLPRWTLAVSPVSSPGDRDRTTDLRASPADFFTRDLDDAVLRGDLDLAVHCAKDMPDPVAPGLDWFWLPWREDARDCLVVPAGATLADTPPRPRIGVSSERRASYGQRRFPGARLLPIRGNIGDRLAQLDARQFDVTIIAAAALIRLGLEARIGAWIELGELPTPPGQGVLALAYRAGDARLMRLRALFTRPVAFVGAGCGRAGLCTAEGLAELRACDVCIHDALIDPSLLDELPAGAERIDAGKRAGENAHAQDETTQTILRHVRRGRRVVRLKGGDPGVFGRLAEEIEALGLLGLPYRVVPGVSSLFAATTGTGMLLTRRGVSQGFCAMTARGAGGQPADVSGGARGRLPVAFFMAGGAATAVTASLQADGWPPGTPAAAVLAAGGESEAVISGTLADLPARLTAALESRCDAGTSEPAPPVLLLCGDVAAYRHRGDQGALRGKRVLLTCSTALAGEAMRCVHDAGGVGVLRPMIRIAACRDGLAWVRDLPAYDWVVVTSPSAVDILMATLRETRTDLRRLPWLLVTGPGTAARLAGFGIKADAQPDPRLDGGSLLACARRTLAAGAHVLRLRSDRAGDGLGAALREFGLRVDDVVLYRNEPARHAIMPAFDMAVFASGSGVESLVSQWGRQALASKTVAAFPGSACAALAKAGVTVDVEAPDPSMAACIGALARREVCLSLEEQA